MVKLSALLVPPPGAGLNTVIDATPADVILAAGTRADNCVALINVVVRAVPFHLMEEVVTKFVPLAISVKDPAPAVAVLGEMLASAGIGLLLVIEKVIELLIPPPGNGVKTVIVAEPTAPIFAAGTVAVNCVALT